MKNIINKYLIAGLAFLAVLGCKEDERDFSYAQYGEGPSELALLFDVYQDNSGTVKMIPTAQGADSFTISFGDSANSEESLAAGETTSFTYPEGVYQVKLTAHGYDGKTAEKTLELVVSFIAPQNLMVTIENSTSISRLVTVTATADFGINFDVYFGEPGFPDPLSANMGDSVEYTYVAPGTYTITVVAMSAAVETTTYTVDFEVTEVLMPLTAAPTPTAAPASVISIYSDAYTGVPLSEVNPGWGQTTTLTEVAIEGNNTWLYENLNYTGIVTSYTSPTDLSAMSHVHFDYWTPESAVATTALGLKLVNTTIGGEDLEFVNNMTPGEWVGVDIPLTAYEAVNLSQISQLLFDTGTGFDGTVFIDNLYFYQDSPSSPPTAAPTPTHAPGTVISLYSDAYTNISLAEINPGWGQTTVLTEVQIAGNNTWKYENLNFSGIVSDYGNPTDLTSMTHLHFDFWTPQTADPVTVLGMKLVNTNIGSEDLEFAPNVSQGTWMSVDIPLADYSTNLSAVSQFIWDTAAGFDGTVFIDNLYFYALAATEPTTAAPTPTVAAANVISLYSDAYTNIGLSEVNPNWGQSTGLTQVQIAGNNTWKYEALNFSGIVSDYGNPTNLSSMTHLHFDYWTPDMTILGMKLVNTNITQEDIEFAPALSQGTWVSVEIPLANYAVDLTAISQFIWDSAAGPDGTVFIDNLYFHN
ncbi:MAG: PKD domain-containing protein [Bacteroidetes bacterium]|nr:PKD domain-containing protein [Bacteroidota bacterium]MDA0879252.1 PKD domain-containing protein [Bacteroidota bacterium]MDA1114861.1 PKD domain-containing protein [Bacteroidota bacterium]